jgi:hypothetical protein
MRLIGNALNKDYFQNIIEIVQAAPVFDEMLLAVAFVGKMDAIFELAERCSVPLTLYALADGERFPSVDVMKRFVEASPPNWRLFLTRAYYHPKILWFRGVGAYIGSANLTEAGWWQNLECGVWLDEEELEESGWDDELLKMFVKIQARSTEAAPGHIALYDKISRKYQDIQRQLFEMRKAIKTDLAMIPGQEPPERIASRGRGEDAKRSRADQMKRAFVTTLQGELTVLRKLAVEVQIHPWPSWVDRTVDPVIAQDQATEYWYHVHIRRSGGAFETIERLHEQNRGVNNTRAVKTMFQEWGRSAVDDAHLYGGFDWAYWANTAPRLLRGWLTREELGNLDEARLFDIIRHTHSAREHARQVPKDELSLAEDETTSKDERCRLLTELLWRQRSREGLSIRDLLLYVIWGDVDTADCAERIWNATQLDKWKLRRLGPSMLGEFLGYARPDKFPPRNGRVPKALRALGFEGVAADEG